MKAPLTTTVHPLIRPVAEDCWEVHYAPMSGGIVLMKGEEMKRAASWAEHHELIAEFQKHFKVGDLVLKRTITYGHPLFSGHRGEVNVYTWKE